MPATGDSTPTVTVTRAEARGWRLALAAVLAVTVWRLVWLPASTLDLFVDESQYWLWGQELSAGAYSKPPLVGWLIRAANVLTGSDAPWVARLPWPLVHGAAALAVMALGRAVAGPAVGALAGVTYATLPAVSLGSVLVSTDSPMMLALAVALLLWWRLAQGAGWGTAVLLGLAIAAGLWAKYAMLFALAGLALALVSDRSWRIGWGRGAVAVAVAAAVFAPNVWWNLRHGMATVRHTAEIATATASPDWAGLAVFTLSQLAVAGPVVFVALASAWGWRHRPSGLRGLLVVATVILSIVMAQALRGGANANWAVGGYVLGAVVAAAVLARHRRWAGLSLALGAALAVALPLLATQARTLRLPDGRLAMARYVGEAEVSGWAIATARAAAGGGPVLILSPDRALTADLMYRALRRGGEAGVTVRAVPPNGRAPDSHYELAYPLTVEAGPAFWLGRDGEAPPCARPLAVRTADEGEWRGKPLQLASVDAGCLDGLR